MIGFYHVNDLKCFPLLEESMFQDRATQFSTRLGWDVHVNEQGAETDQYDTQNPLYVIASKPDGTHAGSMRVLPTVGKTMINDHFLHLTDNVAVQSPFIWEITRFCTAPNADRRTALKLIAAGSFLMKIYDIAYFIAVFDRPMERVYRMIGAAPTILGKGQRDGCEIGVGLWEYNEHESKQLLLRSGLSHLEDPLDPNVSSECKLLSA